MLRRTSVAMAVATASLLAVAAPAAIASASGSTGAATTVTAPPAPNVDSGTGCSTRTTFTPFSFVGDENPYYLTNGGDFESASSRWFGAGAYRVYDNEPWQVGGENDSYAAYLSRTGATLSAPSMCVRDNEPTVRFFYKAPGIPGARLAVKLRTTSAIDTHLSTVYIDGSEPGWHVSDALDITNSTDASGTQNLSLDFTSQGGAWTIDDVYVDPWKYILK